MKYLNLVSNKMEIFNPCLARIFPLCPLSPLQLNSHNLENEVNLVELNSFSPFVRVNTLFSGNYSKVLGRLAILRCTMLQVLIKIDFIKFAL